MLPLRESLLTKTKDKITKAPDTISVEDIRDKLLNSGWYKFISYNNDDTDNWFTIYKKYGKWIVDVHCKVFCYGTPDGMITDGSFRFGTIDCGFDVTAPHGSSKIKSLTYGPVTVKGNYSIWNADKLTNLKDCPKHIYDGIIIHNTSINTLKYFPIWVAGSLLINDNKNLKGVKDTKFSHVECRRVEIRNNGFTSTELTYRELNWDMPYGLGGFRFDKSIALPEFNK